MVEVDVFMTPASSLIQNPQARCVMMIGRDTEASPLWASAGGGGSKCEWRWEYTTSSALKIDLWRPLGVGPWELRGVANVP